MSNDDTSRDTGAGPDKQPTVLAGYKPLKHNVEGGPVAPTRQPRDNPPYKLVSRIADRIDDAYVIHASGRAASPSAADLARLAAGLMDITDEQVIQAAGDALFNSPAIEGNSLRIARYLAYFLLDPSNPAEPPQDPPPVNPAGIPAAVEAGASLLRRRAKLPPLTAKQQDAVTLLGLRLQRVIGTPHAMDLKMLIGPTFDELGVHIPQDAIRDPDALFLAAFHAAKPYEKGAAALAEWLVRKLDVWIDIPPELIFSVGHFFADPDTVGTTAYRTAFDMLEELEGCASDQDEPFGRDEAIVELGELEDVIQSMRSKLSSELSAPAWSFGSPSPDDLRRKGWMVAVHNDYRQAGMKRTFWLLVDESGWSLKGEGGCDAAALDQIRWALTELPQFVVQLPDGEPEVKAARSAFHVAMDTIVEEGGSIVERRRFKYPR